MNADPLVRTGCVITTDPDEVTVQVDTPCTVCDAKCTGFMAGGMAGGTAGGMAGGMVVLQRPPGIAAGERVALQVSRRMLRRAAAALFLPPITVAVMIALLTRLTPEPLLVVSAGTLGLAAALCLGRQLAARQKLHVELLPVKTHK